MPLGKRTDLGDARFAGLELPFQAIIEQSVTFAEACGFDFIVAPLAAPASRPPPPTPLPDGSLRPPFAPGQVMHTMNSAQLSNQIVGHVSTWIDPDAKDPFLAAESLTALQQELAWAAHLTVQACLLPPPPYGVTSYNYAGAINQAIVSATAPSTLWLRIPLSKAASPTATSPAATSDAAPADSMGSVDEDGKTQHTPPAAERAQLLGLEAQPPPDGCALGRHSDPWEWWNFIRMACCSPPRLGVALEIGHTLPLDSDLVRWKAEPVRAIIVRTDAFVTNRKGHPVLPRRHQDFISDAFALGIQVVLSGPPQHGLVVDDAPGSMEPQLPVASLHPPPAPPPPPPPPPRDGVDVPRSFLNSDAFPSLDTSATGAHALPPQHPMRIYWEYISFLFRRYPAVSDQDLLEVPYRDYLQAPLQPLQDNLESQTYETFERDSTKYVYYQEAVRRALLDLNPEPSDADDVSEPPVVLMVVGAGRGPLVAASLAAAEQAGRRIRVYAVEKNPNAVVHLHARALAERWVERGVTIVHADMRAWQAPELADVLVSELLGSFGDNELSPECLDGAQRFLKKPMGISIPVAYTSYVQPIATHKLWVDVAAHDDLEHFETPFVVKLHRFVPIAGCLPVFSFRHPSVHVERVVAGSAPTTGSPDNSRAISLSFVSTLPHGIMCHGLGGYFDTQLYKDVYLSISPETHTPSMSSWFPIYFPLRQPIYVPAGASLEVSMWRRCGTGKVWYEWAIQLPETGVGTSIHNPNGRSYYVGL